MRSYPPERAAGGGCHFGWPFGNVLPEAGALFVGLVVPVVAVVLCASTGSTPPARNSAASAIRVVMLRLRWFSIQRRAATGRS